MNEHINTEDTGYFYYSEEGFSMRMLTPSTWEAVRVPPSGTHSLLLSRKGELRIKVNGKPYLLTENCFADILGESVWEITSASDDVEVLELQFTKVYLGNLLKTKPPFPISYMLDHKEYPVSVLDAETAQTIFMRIETLKTIFNEQEHYFQSDMQKCALWMLFMDMANAYLHGQENETGVRESDRKRMLFMRFTHLLSENVREEHSVAFYASSLCITPQYLNRIVRSVSGRTVSEWITGELAGEIIKRLENSDDPVQRIADELHFADQATMSKFFKKQKGVSPTEYRKRQKL